MNKIIVLSFSLFFLIFTTSEAYPDNLSLKSQIKMDLSIDEIACKNNLVLSQRSNNNLACVYESTAEKLQWDILEYRIFELKSIDSDEVYPISYRLSGGLINKITLTDESHIIEIDFDSWSDGQLDISLPLAFISDEFDSLIILINDDVEIDFETIINLDNQTLIMEFYEGDYNIKIIKTYLI